MSGHLARAAMRKAIRAIVVSRSSRGAQADPARKDLAISGHGDESVVLKGLKYVGEDG